jgi:hypothetical protein
MLRYLPTGVALDDARRPTAFEPVWLLLGSYATDHTQATEFNASISIN